MPYLIGTNHVETIVKIHVKFVVNAKISPKKNVETIVKIHVKVKLKINAKKNVETILQKPMFSLR